MRAVELVFAVGWATFWLYWLVAAFSMRRGRVPWSRELRIRAVIVVAVILLIRLGALRGHGLNTDLWRAGLGLILFALGLGFAICARVHIGRNWGTPMTEKDDPELVTSGPYHLVRHPIYSGILVAGVGTAVALSWLWLIPMALAGIYFVYSATRRRLDTALPRERHSREPLGHHLLGPEEVVSRDCTPTRASLLDSSARSVYASRRGRTLGSECIYFVALLSCHVGLGELNLEGV